MDIDIDFTDTDASSQQQSRAVSRPSRFAPKGFKPPKQPKPKDEPIECSDTVENVASASAAVVKIEESNGSGDVKVEDEAREINNESVGREDGDDEDDVVREIDVFFNPSIDPDSQLYVLQYPLRPCWRPYELDERCEEVRVKPTSTEVEIDLSIDRDSQNFDSERAAELNMTKQTLSTIWKPPRTSGYAAGVLIGEKLHLNPIHAVVQLRPSIKHLGCLKRKIGVSGDGEVIIKSEENREKLVGPSNQRRKQMDSLVGSKIEEESWVQLKYIPPRSKFSTDYLKKMMTQESYPINFKMKPYDYVDSFCPGTASSAKSKGANRRILLAMPLEERIKKILLEGSAFQRYSVIKHFAPDDTNEDVLKEIQKYAVLVQGFWVPKTKYLIGTESSTIQFARDYIINLFARSEIIHVLKDDAFPKLSKHMPRFLDMLAHHHKHFKYWKFKEAKDTVFERSYPNVVKKQKENWENIERSINAILDKEGRNRPSMKGNAIKYSIHKKPKSSTETPSRSMAMTKETRDALLKALLKLFRDQKVCSYHVIRDGMLQFISEHCQLKPDSGSFSAEHVINSPDALKSVISEVAIEIDGLYAMKSSGEYPEFDPLRRVVIDLFRVSGRNAKFTKTQIRGAAKEVLKRDITDNEYVKVMKELCESKGPAWFLKGGDSSSR